MHSNQRQFDRTPRRGGLPGQKISKVFMRIIWVASLLIAVSVMPMGAHGARPAKHVKPDKMDTKLRHGKVPQVVPKFSVIVSH